jgi:hypothetical protein
VREKIIEGSPEDRSAAAGQLIGEIASCFVAPAKVASAGAKVTAVAGSGARALAAHGGQCRPRHEGADRERQGGA